MTLATERFGERGYPSERMARAESVWRVKRAGDRVRRVLAMYAKIASDEGCLRSGQRDAHAECEGYLIDTFNDAVGDYVDLRP